MTDQTPTRLEQLKRALDQGAIDQDTYDTAVAAITAQLAGSGAIAQGQGAAAIGAAGVGVAGNNYGDINTGLIIQQGTRVGASGQDLRRAYLARILAQANQLPLFTGDSANAQGGGRSLPGCLHNHAGVAADIDAAGTDCDGTLALSNGAATAEICLISGAAR